MIAMQDGPADGIPHETGVPTQRRDWYRSLSSTLHYLPFGFRIDFDVIDPEN